MARAAANTAPAVLMGSALLSAIAAGTVTRVTQEQAASLDASHFQVNTSDVVDGAAAVQLTDAGTAAAGAAPTPARAGIQIDDGVPIPTGSGSRAPREQVYPFDALQVNQSFHVAKTTENPEPHIRLSSSVSGARTKYSPVILGSDGKPVMETYQSPTYAKDAAGNWVKGPDGKRVKTGEETKTRELRGEPSRDFVVKAVDASDPKGVGARCWRTK